jgi:ADP-heptose:LPS heptosyltransferase
MGDVALLSPVVYAALKQNPDLKIDVLSRDVFAPLFPKKNGLDFIGVDFKAEYKGLFGIYRLYRHLKSNKYDFVLDEHAVIRSYILCFLFFISRIKVITFNKGRNEKKALVRKKNKVFIPLKHTSERYAEPLRKIGLEIHIDENVLPNYGKPGIEIENFINSFSPNAVLIGIAPFAKHASKTWGIEPIKNVMLDILNKYPNTVFLLFGGLDDRLKLEEIANACNTGINVSGRFTFEEELHLIGKLKLMISMDSANMHLASICKIPVLSIWGGTHPYAGFGPLFNEHGIIQVDLPCRPSTIYGKISQKWQQDCYTQAFEAIDINDVSQKAFQLIKS